MGALVLLVMALVESSGVGIAATLIMLAVLAFVAYGLWRGRRRGSQIVAVLFGAVLWLASPWLLPVGLAMILLVTVPQSARNWFAYRR